MTYTVKAYYKYEHGDGPIVVTTPGEMDAAIDAMLSEPFRNSVAALYVTERASEPGRPGPELRIAVHAEAKVGGLRFAGEHDGTPGVWYAAGQVSDRDEVFYYYMGHDEGWPQDSEVSLDEVRAAVKELLASGERPVSPAWREWPQDVG